MEKLGLGRNKGGDVMQIARVVGPKIDDTVNLLFETYGERLMDKPPVYVVPAIWGADKKGGISPLQKQISEKVAPVIRDLEKAFDNGRLSRAQLFGIGYLARGMLVSKLLYMLEAARNQWGVFTDTDSSDDAGKDSLVHMKPIGNA